MQASSNSWTGGQYSVLRALLALATLPMLFELRPDAGLVAQTHSLGPWFPDLLGLCGILESPSLAWTILLLGVLLSALLFLDIGGRFAACALACLLLSIRADMPGLPGISSWPIGESLLLLHVFIPSGPFGSWSARTRGNPGGDWCIPNGLMAGCWLLLAIPYLSVAVGAIMFDPDLHDRPWYGLAKLALYLSIIPLALWKKLRPFCCATLFLLQLGLFILNPVATGALLLVAHIFLFDPAWMPPNEDGEFDTIFYDGTCGLCHRTVRFLLAEDRQGGLFRYAPLGQAHFFSAIRPEARASLPDSLVLFTHDGALLVRSQAVLLAMHRLGGLWRLSAALLKFFPLAFRDLVYDAIAQARYSVFGRKEELCPLLAPSLQSRFFLAQADMLVDDDGASMAAEQENIMDANPKESAP